MGKGKGYVSARDLLGGEPDPSRYIGFYGVLEYSYPPYWLPEGYGAECRCWRCWGCEENWERGSGEAK